MIDIYALPDRPVDLGRLGENEHRRVLFDVSEYVTMYPNATYTVINRPYQSDTAYPVPTVTRDGDCLIWTVTASDVAAEGRGECELIVTVDDVIAKSIIYSTVVKAALDGSGEVPTPVEAWQAELNSLRVRVDETTNTLANMRATAETLPEDEQATAEYADGVLTIGVPKGDTGETGAPGTDGISPTITVTDITGGHRVTITDATGPHSFDVMDGEGGGAVQDVQVNGVSVLSDGVANVPLASTTDAGVMRVVSSFGHSVSAGILGHKAAVESTLKRGTDAQDPVVSRNSYIATFYGLAKAAGNDEKDSALLLGQHTESAKSAISEMLNGSVTVDGTTPTINAMPGVRYVCGEVSTIDIVTPESGIVDVVFTSGATPAVLTVTPPTGMTMKWANGFDPDNLEADTTYEINIADGCLGVAGQWT